MPFSLTTDGRLSLIRSNNNNEQNSDNLLIEKNNLISIFKLVINELLDISLRQERIIEKEYFHLQHFFIIFEHILYHGYSGKKIFPINSLTNRKDLWPLIELITRKSIDNSINEILISIKDMTNIRTSLGRLRAWLRLALMQKRLADYFKILCEQKQELNDFYDKQAILLSDENVIINGLLLGLNVLDFNFCLKEINFDYPIESLIHYSIYLRERTELERENSFNNLSLSENRILSLNEQSINLINSHDEISVDDGNNQRVSNILDQKNYLEELNRHLQKMIQILEERLKNLEQTNKNLREDANIQKNRIEQLGGELTKITTEKDQIQLAYQRKIEILVADIETERQTYRNSRLGFDAMYNELQKKYDEERLSKQTIEEIYQNQLSTNNNYLVSTKKFEEDIETKTTLYNLAKEENHRLIEQIEIESTRYDEQERRIESLERENHLLEEKINKFQITIDRLNSQLRAFGDANDVLTRTLTKLEGDKSSLETDYRMEQEFHQRLKTALNNEKEQVSKLQFDIHELTLIKQEYEKYKKDTSKKLTDYEEKFHEQDQAIQELANKLEMSLRREDEIREKDELRSSILIKDSKVKECGLCKKEFGTFARKHHCRNCGQIFCETCASIKISLPNSIKPVRVCDTCRNNILAQCTINNS